MDIDIDKSTSYRPISLLSVIPKTLKKSLLPYITTNIPNTPTQHGYKIQHSTVTALHTLNTNVEKGFNQMAPPARTITVTFDNQKAATDQHSRHNHEFNRKLHQGTQILHNIQKPYIHTTST